MKVIKVSAQENFIVREDRLIFSLHVQTENDNETEFVKLDMPFTVSDLTTGLRALADHLDKKYRDQ